MFCGILYLNKATGAYNPGLYSRERQNQMNEFEEKKETGEGEAIPPAPTEEAREEEHQPEAAESAVEEEHQPDVSSEDDGTRPSAEESEGEAAQPVSAEPDEPAQEPQEERKPERTFTQDEVNSIVSRRLSEAKERAYKEGRESAIEELRGKWGVETDDELDALFGDGQRYNLLNDEYRTAQSDLTSLKGENALLKAGIPQDRWDDVRAIVAFSGGELTPETIASLIETHPEWKPSAAQKPAKEPEYGTPQKPIVATFGRERPDVADPGKEKIREFEEAMKMLGLGDD